MKKPNISFYPFPLAIIFLGTLISLFLVVSPAKAILIEGPGISASLTVQNDNNNNDIVNIGDTIRVAVNINGDGSCSSNVQADLRAYGGSQNQNINGCTSNANSNNSSYMLDLLVQDGGDNGIEVGANNSSSAVNVSIINLETSTTTNTIGDGEVDTSDGVDTIAPEVDIILPEDQGATQHVSPLEVFTSQTANCEYDLDDDDFVPLSFSGNILHTDRFRNLSAGSHTVELRCTDSAGNQGLDSSTWTKVVGQQMLYGANGAGGNPDTHLFILDPESGDIVQDIGSINDVTNSSINYPVTGLAFDPINGTLYGTTGGGGRRKILSEGEERTQKLITIDPLTGSGTLIGTVTSTVVDNENSNTTITHNMADIAFSASGSLYGWSEPNLDDLHLINKTTAVATSLGDSELETSGSGLEFANPSNFSQVERLAENVNFNASPSLYLTGTTDEGDLDVINPFDGSVDQSIPLRNTLAVGEEEEGYDIAALTSDQNGILLGSRLTTGIIEEEDFPDLVFIDQNTGVIISMGENEDLEGMDAIAFNTLNQPAGALSVTITNPSMNATLFSSSFTLQATTNHNANCSSKLDSGTFQTMSVTGATSHSQNYTSVNLGQHTAMVNCVDNNNNNASASVNFSIVTRLGGGGGGGGGGGSIVPPSNTNVNTNTNSGGSTNTNSGGGTNTNVNGPFSDTNDPFVNMLAEKCGAQGFRDDVNNLRLFMPNKSMLRGELIKLLMYCKYGELSVPAEKPFPDVEVTSPFAPYIAKAKELHFVTGYEAGPFLGTFQELQEVTREEALTMILRVAVPLGDVLQVVGTNPENVFKDTDPSQWYYPDVYYSFVKKYTEGYRDLEGNLLHIFGLGDPVARAHAAKWIVLIVLEASL